MYHSLNTIHSKNNSIRVVLSRLECYILEQSLSLLCQLIASRRIIQSQVGITGVASKGKVDITTVRPGQLVLVSVTEKLRHSDIIVVGATEAGDRITIIDGS